MSGYLAYTGGKTQDEALTALARIVDGLPGAFQFGEIKVVPITAKNREWWDGKLPKGTVYVAMRMVWT